MQSYLCACRCACARVHVCLRVLVCVHASTCMHACVCAGVLKFENQKILVSTLELLQSKLELPFEDVLILALDYVRFCKADGAREMRLELFGTAVRGHAVPCRAVPCRAVPCCAVLCCLLFAVCRAAPRRAVCTRVQGERN